LTVDLFLAAFPSAKWPEILALSSATAKGRAFHLMRSRGWTEGERLAQVAGFDYRTRCSRLRDLGVPVETMPSSESPCYLFRIPTAFLMAYEEKLNERRTA
jgi:hypothetical protein